MEQTEENMLKRRYYRKARRAFCNVCPDVEKCRESQYDPIEQTSAALVVSCDKIKAFDDELAKELGYHIYEILIMKQLTINTKFIVKMYPVEEEEFTSDYIKVYSAGEEYGWLFWKHIAEDDIFEEWFTNKQYTRSELNKILLEEADEYHIFERDGIVYKKPYVCITLIDDSSYHKYFDTFDDCIKFISRIKDENMTTIIVE